MDTEYPICGKIGSFHFYNIIYVATNNSQVTFQFVENKGNTMENTVFFYSINFHSTSDKTDCRNEYNTFECGETVSFTFITASMLAEIILK